MVPRAGDNDGMLTERMAGDDVPDATTAGALSDRGGPCALASLSRCRQRHSQSKQSRRGIDGLIEMCPSFWVRSSFLYRLPDLALGAHHDNGYWRATQTMSTYDQGVIKPISAQTRTKMASLLADTSHTAQRQPKRRHHASLATRADDQGIGAVQRNHALNGLGNFASHEFNDDRELSRGHQRMIKK